MSWATHYITKLQAGFTVQFRPRGNSMTGKVNDGALCTVIPADIKTIDVGDVGLCSVRGKQYLHLVKAIKASKGLVGDRFLIGNNKGHLNGWVGPAHIYGKLEKVEP